MIPTRDLVAIAASNVKYSFGKLFNTKAYQKFEEEKWLRVRKEQEAQWRKSKEVK